MNKLCDQLGKEIQYSRYLFFQTLKQYEERYYAHEIGNVCCEMIISLRCTSRVVEFFIPRCLMPFGEMTDDTIFPKYAWILRDERKAKKQKCTSFFLQTSGRFDINLVKNDWFPLCVKSVEFRLINIDQDILQITKLSNFDATQTFLRRMLKIHDAFSYNDAQYLRLLLSDCENYTDCKTYQSVHKTLYRYFEKVLSKTSVDSNQIPKESICPITLEPFDPESSPVVQLILPKNQNICIVPDSMDYNNWVSQWCSMEKGASFFYRRSDLQAHFNHQMVPFTDWVPYRSSVPIDDSGRGGFPGGNEFYLKTPHNLLLLIDVRNDPDHLLTRSAFTTFLLIPIKHKQRVGGMFSSTFNMSEEHGAAPGHTIYFTVPLQTLIQQ